MKEGYHEALRVRLVDKESMRVDVSIVCPRDHPFRKQINRRAAELASAMAAAPPKDACRRPSRE